MDQNKQPQGQQLNIELGEKAESALLREIEEEMGKTGEVGHFVGAVEHTWVANQEEHYEINLVFEISIPGLEASIPLASLEPQIEFIWAKLNELKTHNLQPYPLLGCIQNLKHGWKGFWGSSLK